MTMFLEAINSYGGISADWVLVTLAGMLILIISFGLKILISILKEIKLDFKEHEQRLNENEKQHIQFRSDIDSGIREGNRINADQDQKLDKIFEKLDRLRSA